MIHVCNGNVKILEFTGKNWLECGKFLELPEIQALYSSKDVEILEKSIQHSVRPYQLHRGSCLVCTWPSKQVIPYKSRAEIPYKFPMCMGPCIVEDTNAVIRAFQYNYQSDLKYIMEYLGSWKCHESGYDENGYPEFFIYDPANMTSGCTIARTDWMLFYIQGKDSPISLRHMPDALFQIEYNQIGHIITKRKLNTDIALLSEAAASMDALLIIPEITGGFAPGVQYKYTAQNLSLLGRRAKIVESKTKYIALQYNSPKIIDAIKAIYPMLNFVEDVYYRDWPTLVILMGTLPAGSIKREEWIIFEPSSPGNPRFKIVSNEEYQKQYRVWKSDFQANPAG